MKPKFFCKFSFQNFPLSTLEPKLLLLEGLGMTISHTNSFNDKLNCLLKGTDGVTIHEIEGLYFFKYMLLKQAVLSGLYNDWLPS